MTNEKDALPLHRKLLSQSLRGDLFQLACPAIGLKWKAESRGLALDRNNLGWMSHYTEARVRNFGIPIEDYLRLPQDVTHDDFQSADHVVAVKEAEHRSLMQQRFPNWLEKVEFWKVHDLDCATPDEAFPLLEQNVMELIGRLKQ